MTQDQFRSIKLPTLKTTYDIKGNLMLLKRQLNDIIENKKSNVLYLERKAIEIDWVILNLAQHTLLNNKNEEKEVSRLKENAWNLLERLENYCLTNLNISIW